MKIASGTVCYHTRQSRKLFGRDSAHTPKADEKPVEMPWQNTPGMKTLLKRVETGLWGVEGSLMRAGRK